MTSETQKRDLKRTNEFPAQPWAQAVIFQRDDKSPTGWKVGS